jgi:hypothetical protein
MGYCNNCDEGLITVTSFGPVLKQHVLKAIIDGKIPVDEPIKQALVCTIGTYANMLDALLTEFRVGLEGASGILADRVKQATGLLGEPLRTFVVKVAP